MKYYIVAGEASGDLHASNLLLEIKKLDADAVFRGWGGDNMELQGAEIVKHYRHLAFMGFVEVVANIRTIARNLNLCKKDILQFKPDVVILVDYPGFNLRIAEFLKQNHIKTFYYISPQIWAWKQSRVHQIKRNVDRMFVILPFEKDFYKRFNMVVDFVGHPLLDAIEQFTSEKVNRKGEFRTEHCLGDKKLIALLPGSRKMEIEKMLPVMMEVANKNPTYQFVIAGAPAISPDFYKQYTNQNTKIVFGNSYELLMNAHAALVTSGTATLETALFKVPQVVCYKGSVLSYHIARWLVKVKYISLVNLILDKPAVKELIQDDMNAEDLNLEFKKVAADTTERKQILSDYNVLIEKLGNSGASARTAQLMLNYLNNKK